MIILDRLIKQFGSQVSLAKELGVKQAQIAMWKKNNAISSQYISAIVRASNGTITHEELCDELERLAKERKAKKAK